MGESTLINFNYSVKDDSQIVTLYVGENQRRTDSVLVSQGNNVQWAPIDTPIFPSPTLCIVYVLSTDLFIKIHFVNTTWTEIIKAFKLDFNCRRRGLKLRCNAGVAFTALSFKFIMRSSGDYSADKHIYFQWSGREYVKWELVSSLTNSM